MKKLISILLIITVVLSAVACGKKKPAEDEINNDTSVLTDNVENSKEDLEQKNPDVDADTNTNTEQPQKPVVQKPAESSKPSDTSSQTKPAEKPENQPVPAPKPESKPEETPKTIGYTLLADFKAKAPSMGVQALAEALISNPAIAFMGGASPVSEGLLSGFGNTEIKGFKEGAMFAPMIGSIPFVGYVFELDDAANAPAFISTLKSNADLRWNVCVEADEMVTGSVGSKVFFVMSPFSFEE
ncbi:MAG: hypothetical protein IJV86_04700 [Clostridia bacterium]|nr:hypothetical protein [Clostridia bacterium]